MTFYILVFACVTYLHGSSSDPPTGLSSQPYAVAVSENHQYEIRFIGTSIEKKFLYHFINHGTPLTLLWESQLPLAHVAITNKGDALLCTLNDKECIFYQWGMSASKPISPLAWQRRLPLFWGDEPRPHIHSVHAFSVSNAVMILFSPALTSAKWSVSSAIYDFTTCEVTVINLPKTRLATDRIYDIEALPLRQADRIIIAYITEYMGAGAADIQLVAITSEGAAVWNDTMPDYRFDRLRRFNIPRPQDTARLSHWENGFGVLVDVSLTAFFEVIPEFGGSELVGFSEVPP